MAIATSEARRGLFRLIEQVNLGHSEIESMSKEEYDALVETSYLLRSLKNAHRVLSTLNSAREGDVVEHELIEP